jgi:outer membrane protein insertion porin family
MKLFLSRILPLGLFLFCFLPSAAAQQTIQEIQIRHIGPPAASDDLIRANIRVRPGDLHSRVGIDDDVRALYATGLFYNIQVAEERAPQGVRVIYVVQGRPTLTDLRFEGNDRYSDRRLSKRITSKTGEPLDERKLFQDTQEILTMYQKGGYHRTEVRYNLNIDETAGRAKATFQITESPKVRIQQVEFVGAEAFTQKRLRRVVKTRRYWMFSWITGSGRLKDEVFEDDKEKLAEFYRNEGYIDFELKDVQFEFPEARRMIVRFFINEGRQYRVGSVEIQGNSLFPTEQIMAPDRSSSGIRMGPGEVFTPKGLSNDLEAIRDFYGARGYIDTWVRPVQVPNVERGTIDLVYEIQDEDRGKSFIEKIEIRGNTKTKDKVIRRELAVAPGEVFDMVRVKRSRSRLEQMGYFEKVDTDVEPTAIAPERKNLVIGVEEGNTGSVEMGAGFSSVDNLVGFIGYREGNFDLFNPPYFRGGGQKFRINVQIGTRRKDFQISFVEPWFLNRRLAFGTDLYHRELNFYSDLYDVRQTGARFSLTKALGSEFLVGSVSYTIENISIFNVDPTAPLVIRQEPRNRLVSKVGSSIAWDTRNNVALPDRGHRIEFLNELAGGPFGGDTDFYKLRLSGSQYFPGFFAGHVWEIIGQAGVVDNYGDSNRVPLFDRYFLGGVTSLRGFRYRKVGPHQEGEPIGGETYWFGSVEYSIPIIERLRFATFYDIGNVYEDAYSFDLAPGQKNYNDNWGVGLRLNIPRLGPLRLDYAFPITHDEFTTGSGRFQFSVGFTRDF